MVTIVWTEISIKDLREIFEFIAEDSVRYALITSNKIYKRAQIVSSNVHIGRMVPEFNDPLIREVIEGNYRIIYRVKGEHQADILRVYHSARFIKEEKL
ncbi:MAG: type II toxin-antitoxin system RelE/ParE family toxin [Saprospiraceae bacterium]